MDRRENAVYLKHNGYNCCQAVLKAYEDLHGLSDSTLRALGSGFGGGMGTMQATCGALVAANIVLGLLNGTGKATIPFSRILLNRFKELSGASICGDLKGIETGKILCACDDCVRNAVDALEEVLSLCYYR